jgi:hypothetical protein
LGQGNSFNFVYVHPTWQDGVANPEKAYRYIEGVCIGGKFVLMCKLFMPS